MSYGLFRRELKSNRRIDADNLGPWKSKSGRAWNHIRAWNVDYRGTRGQAWKHPPNLRLWLVS